MSDYRRTVITSATIPFSPFARPILSRYIYQLLSGVVYERTNNNSVSFYKTGIRYEKLSFFFVFERKLHKFWQKFSSTSLFELYLANILLRSSARSKNQRTLTGKITPTLSHLFIIPIKILMATNSIFPIFRINEGRKTRVKERIRVNRQEERNTRRGRGYLRAVRGLSSILDIGPNNGTFS